MLLRSVPVSDMPMVTAPAVRTDAAKQPSMYGVYPPPVISKYLPKIASIRRDILPLTNMSAASHVISAANWLV